MNININIKKTIGVTLSTIMLFVSIPTTVFADYTDSQTYDGIHAESALGLIDRGNHKDANLNGSSIIVPRPANSNFVGGYGNNWVDYSVDGYNFYDLDGLTEKQLKYIDSFVKRGGTMGYSEGYFMPNKTWTNNQFIQSIAYLGFRPVEYYTDDWVFQPYQSDIDTINSPFNAEYVRSFDWAYQSTLIAKECGIFGTKEAWYRALDGSEASRSNPNDLLTRENAMFILSNMVDYDDEDMLNYKLNFNDLDKMATDDYTKMGVSALVSKGIVNGDANGNLNPKEPITILETVTILERLFEYYNNDMLVIHDNLYKNYYKDYWEDDLIYFEQVNKDRELYGEKPFEYEPSLTAMARVRIIDNIETVGINTTDHHYSNTYNGLIAPDLDRFFPINYANENIGIIPMDDPTELNVNFMASKGHAGTFLACDKIGVSAYLGTNVQVFSN